MFLVSAGTVELLFKAQKEELRGRLRLDLSSRCAPVHPHQPLELRQAEEAVGERLLRLLKSCAGDAALFGGKGDPFPPPANHQGRLLILRGPAEFEPFVVRRLQETFGLNLKAPDLPQALHSLAKDLVAWLRHHPELANPLGIQVIEQNDGTTAVFLRCDRPPQETFAPLEHGAEPHSTQSDSAEPRTVPALST